MAISVHYSEGETLNHSGWVAKSCVKCRCIHAFSIHEIVERTSVSLGFVPIAGSSRRTNSCIAQCDFCGTMVRQKPRIISTSWNPSLDMALLIAETMPEATPEQAPTTDLGGVIAVLSQHIQTLKRELTGWRPGLAMMAMIYGVLLFISVSCFLAPPSRFTSETTLILVTAGSMLIPAPIAYLLTRLISGLRYRRRCDAIIDQRLRHLEDCYRIGAGELDRAREELARVR